MDVNKLESLPPPPGVMGSLRAGFDAVSSHVVLILLPVALDLFLWLGPRLSAGDLYSSIISDWMALNRRAGFSLQNADIITQNMGMFGRFNLLNWIRTLPIGVPSLLWGILPDSLPMQTPLGMQGVVQISSMLGMIGWFLVLTLAGWIGGGLYFRWVSGTTLGEKEPGVSLFRAIVQTLVLSVIWVVLLMIILIPAVMVVTLLALISPLLGNAAVLIFLIVSFWLVVPLFFTPHGIFVQKLNAFHSILSSLKLARFTLPTSSMFVFAIFVLSNGLDILWRVPSVESWMMLVGIAGHAFIATALLSASFVYYHDMNAWLQLVFNQLQQNKGLPTQQA